MPVAILADQFGIIRSVLDPVLFDMLDPAVRRLPTTTTLARRDIASFVYEIQFDQRRLNYLLVTLLSLVRFGGQSFDKIARGTLLKRSIHTELVRRAHEGQRISLSCHNHHPDALNSWSR